MNHPEQLELELDFGGPPKPVYRRLTVNPQSLVYEFHQVFGCAIEQIEPSVISSRLSLLREEYHELKDELDGAVLSLTQDGKVFNMHKIAKETADLLYVVYGLAVNLGINATNALQLVHESNMSKLGVDGKPIFRDDGKVLKGPNYFEPDMTGTWKEIDNG